jgi:WD40 repeat protein
LLDVTTGEVHPTNLHVSRGAFEALCFAPDGKIIVWSVCEPRSVPEGKPPLWNQWTSTVHWWGLAAGKELRRLEGSLLAASADGKWLAIRQEQEVLLWDMAAGKEARRFPFKDIARPNADREQFVGGFAAEGSALVVPDGGTLRILDTRTGAERHALPGHHDDVVFVGFTPDGRRLISAGDRSVRFWDPYTGKEVGSLRGPAYALSSASISANGKTLAGETGQSVVHLWDLEAGKELRTLALEAPPAHPAPALDSDGNTVAVVNGRPPDTGISAFDVATGRELRRFGCGGNSGLAFLPDSSAVAVLGNSITLFDPQTGKQLPTLVEPNYGCSERTGMAFSRDSRIVATGYPDRAHGKVRPMDTVSLWEVASGKFIVQFRGHEGLVAAFAFSHDSRVVASGGWDGTVRLWDLASGRELRQFEGHRGGVLSLAFSPDDKLLASGGSDTSILVWDVADLTANRPLPVVRLSREDLEKCWRDLGADSAEVAYRALWKFAAGGKFAVTFLKEQLWSDPSDERRVKQFIADLDADQFEARDRAMRELTNLGAQAQPLLQKALEGRPAPELRRRVETLLAKLQNPGQANEGLRRLRAIQALEYAGTAEAREVLQVLAEKQPETATGLAAKAALKRLARPQP